MDTRQRKPEEEKSGEDAPATLRRKRGPKAGTEAARRGGMAARDRHGSEFYRQIGAKGGATLKARRGLDFYSEIGKRGGETTKKNLGREHYQRIGKIGGQHRGQRSKQQNSGPPPDGAAE